MRRLLVLTVLLAAACAAELPEPDSVGATLLRERCGGCHAAPAPRSMTIVMWEMQIDRKRALFAREGLAWFTPGEAAALRAYLRAHAGTQ